MELALESWINSTLVSGFWYLPWTSYSDLLVEEIGLAAIQNALKVDYYVIMALL